MASIHPPELRPANKPSTDYDAASIDRVVRARVFAGTRHRFQDEYLIRGPLVMAAIVIVGCAVDAQVLVVKETYAATR